MIDKIIVSVVLGAVGFSGLFPDLPQPLTPRQLQQKAKEASKGAVCEKKKQSEKVKRLCKRWGYEPNEVRFTKQKT